MKVKRKCVALDAVTAEFIATLKERRLSAGLTQKSLAYVIGVNVTSVSDYERGRAMPSLRNLIRLASVLGYDLSDSINYKFFYRQINVATLRSMFNKLGMSYMELSKLTGYDARLVKDSLLQTPTGSLPCLYAVNAVLERERGMLQKGRRQKHG